MTRFTLKYLLVALLALLSAGCGSSSSSNAPTTIPTAATVFYSHTLAFRNSTTLMSWGYNGFGQLGRGGNDFANSSVPVPVVNGTGLSGFAAGGVHTVAFINNSTARAWGYNGFGQLGNNSTDTSSKVPVAVFVNQSTTRRLSGVTAVAAGAFHSVALKSDDTVWAWGSNSFGQLGRPFNEIPASSRIAVQAKLAAAPTGARIASIAAGSNHTLALMVDPLTNQRFVLAWGYNGSGQIGIDKATQAFSEPVRVNGLPATITAIAAAGSYNLAIDGNRNVWAWGYNGFGQLGNKSTADSFLPVLVTTDGTTPLANIVQVAAGLDHALAIDGNGNLWAWGYNGFGQLGSDSTLKKTDSSVAVPVIAESTTATSTSPFTPFAGATEIRAFGHSSMVKKGSSWYAWGDNSFGQLGINNTTNQPFPVKVTGF